MKLYMKGVASPWQKVPPSHITSLSFPARHTLFTRVTSPPDWEGGAVLLSSLCAQH